MGRRGPTRPGGVGGYRQQLRDGLAFIRRDALLPSILVVFMGANLLENALFAVLLPTYTEQVLDSPVALGLAIGALGGGALAGAVLYGAFGHRLPRRLTVIVASGLSGPPTVAEVDPKPQPQPPSLRPLPSAPD